MTEFKIALTANVVMFIILILCVPVFEHGIKTCFNKGQLTTIATRYNTTSLKLYQSDYARKIVLPSDYKYSLTPFVDDADGDGHLDMLVVSEAKNETTGSIVLFLKDGTLKNGWQLELGYDIDEILGVTYLSKEKSNAFILRADVWNSTTSFCVFIAITVDGKVSSSFYMQFEGSYTKNIIFDDINNDHKKEFVLVKQNGTIFIVNEDGSILPGWPQKINETVFSSPVVMDINNDGQNDIIVCSDTGFVYAWGLDGQLIPGFPKKINVKYGEIAEGFREMPVIGDFNNDGKFELFISSTLGYLYGLSLDPNSNSSWYYRLPSAVYSSTQLVASDLDYDGVLELIQPTYNSLSVFHLINNILDMVFSANKSIYRLHGSPAIADLDKDNLLEIVVADYNFLHVFSYNGTLEESLHCSSSIADVISPLIFDVESDKEIEIVDLTLFGVINIFETDDFGYAPWIYPLMSPSHSTLFDEDNDMLKDWEEVHFGTNIYDKDTDKDGVIDGLEVNQYLLDPTVQDIDRDSDNDNLTNIREVDVYHTNPLNPDTDFDGLTDSEEMLQYNTNPLSPDTDGDGLFDKFEVTYSVLNPNDPTDAKKDPDNDGLTNIDEQSWGTNPMLNDTDHDTLLDGDEVYKYITNPLVPDEDADYDDDGLTNVEEVDKYHTNPSNPDTDGDTYLDGIEVKYGSDPLDPNSIPVIKKSNWYYSLIAIPFVIAIIAILIRKIRLKKLKSKFE